MPLRVGSSSPPQQETAAGANVIAPTAAAPPDIRAYIRHACETIKMKYSSFGMSAPTCL